MQGILYGYWSFFGGVNNILSLIPWAWNLDAGNLHVSHGLRIPKETSMDVHVNLDGSGLYKCEASCVDILLLLHFFLHL